LLFIFFLSSVNLQEFAVTKLNIASFTDKKAGGKSKDEQMQEKKQELEKRLQDVSGQLGSAKKAPKKGII